MTKLKLTSKQLKLLKHNAHLHSAYGQKLFEIGTAVGESVSTELLELRQENKKLKKALAELIGAVDEALLYDEELSKAWDDLNKATRKAIARTALGDKK